MKKREKGLCNLVEYQCLQGMVVSDEVSRVEQLQVFKGWGGKCFYLVYLFRCNVNFFYFLDFYIVCGIFWGGLKLKVVFWIGLEWSLFGQEGFQYLFFKGWLIIFVFFLLVQGSGSYCWEWWILELVVEFLGEGLGVDQGVQVYCYVISEDEGILDSFQVTIVRSKGF